MASPTAAAKKGRSNSITSNSTNKSTNSNENGNNNTQGNNNASSPSGTVFYQWIVSPVCDSICKRVPSWVHPDFISFLGLCCASAAAYCCCAAHRNDSGSPLAIAALFWVLYGIFDNVDGKQARRLGMCSAGGDFFDHASDSVSSSFAALILMHMLCNRVSGAGSGAAGQQQECVSLAFLRYIPGLSALLPEGGLGFRVCFQPAATLNIHPNVFNFCFVMLSQIPFFIATWAHPIVGRTILSASIEGPGSFSVDELNLLVIPGLLLLKALHPWVFLVPVGEAVHKLPLLGPLVSPYVEQYLGGIRGFFLPPLQQQQMQQLQLQQRQLPQQQLTLGVCVLIISVAFAVVQSCRMIGLLLSRDHLPRFLPGIAFFIATFWFSPPLGLQIICFSLLCLELIAARLKLHMRSLLYLWSPVVLYTFFCLCLSPPLELQQVARAAGVSAMLKGDAASPFLLSRVVYRVRRSYEVHELCAVFSFAVLFCCLFIYKHIINRRNHPRARGSSRQKQD